MPHRTKALALAITFLLVAASMSLVTAASASHGTVPVAVTISRVQAIEDPDPIQGDADMYSIVTIDGFSSQQSAEVGNDNDIEPFWVFSRNVDSNTAGDVIPITIEVLDADVFPAEPDDEIDLNPVDAKTALTLLLDLTDGTWTFGGDPIAANATSTTGDGDTEHGGIFEGGEQGRIFFDISILSTSGDADGDGLLDGWETNGIDVDGNGTIDVNLPAFGADPLHKDLFLEFDWMTGEEPTQAAVNAMKAAFAAAPSNAGTNAAALGGTNANTNPDGLPGINLWVDTGGLTDATASEDGGGANTCGDGIDNGPDGLTDSADPDCLVGDNLGGGNSIAASGISNLNAAFYAVKGANFNANRQWIFRYGLSAQPGTGFGGGWGEVGGNDFIEYNHDGGTIMHELGHTVNLRHGGNENANCKPNYVSVMNYDNQFGINQAGGGSIIDYSPPRFAGGRGSAPLGSLTENALSEASILDATDATNQFVFVNGTGAKVRSQLNAPVDWNGNGNTTDAGLLTVNIDTSGTGGSPAACTNGGSSSTRAGHDDWTRISIPFRSFGDAADGAINPITEPEMTIAELLDLVAELNTADVEIDKTDLPDPAVAGEQLTYALTVTNNGPNPASDVLVDDTLPSGVTYVSDDGGCTTSGSDVTCDLGELANGETVVIEITVLIDADLVFVANGPTTITNAATVENAAGPDPDLTNNSSSENTDVLAKADLEIVSYGAIDPPTQIIVGEDIEITTRKVITNNGPSAPMDTRLTPTATSSPGTTVTPTSVVTEEPALGFEEEREVIETFLLSCEEASAHQFTFSNEIQPFHPADMDLSQNNNTAEFTLDVECVVPVQINIKPGSDPNSIIIGAGTVTVAILSTDIGEYGLPLGFDATTIDPLSVRFGPHDTVFDDTGGATARHKRGHFEDSLELDEITNDGDTDLVLHFRTRDTGILTGDTEACVKGNWIDAAGAVHTFFGCDVIRIVPAS